MKEKNLTVIVPILGTEDFIVDVNTMPTISNSEENVIYRYRDYYYRLINNVIERVENVEFPEIGKPLEIFTFTYDATRMGTAPTIAASVVWRECLDDKWRQDCHVLFGGRNYYIGNIPTSSRSNEADNYKHEITFFDERVALERVYFFDVVIPYITEKPVSESTKFSFFGDITELQKRINASLIRSKLAHYALKIGVTEYFTLEEWNAIGLGTYSGDLSIADPYYEEGVDMHRNIYSHFEGNYSRYLMSEVLALDTDGNPVINGYHVEIGKDMYGETCTSEEKLATFEDNTIHEALQQINETYGLQYYFRYDNNGDVVIVIGDSQWENAETDASGSILRGVDKLPSNPISFAYGSDKELMEITKTNNTQQIVTRCTGYGSTENIPWYYPNPTPDGWIRPIFKHSEENATTEVTIDYPQTEGDTRESSARFDKFIKNSLGDEFVYGHAVKKLNTDFEENFSAWGTNENYPDLHCLVLIYVLTTRSTVDNVTSAIEDAYLKMSMSIPDSVVRYSVELINKTDNTSEVFESDASYTDPTDFQQYCLNGFTDVDVPLLSDKAYNVVVSVYMNEIPLSQKYDYAGYHYDGHSNWKSIRERVTNGPIVNVVHIREDFYEEQGLVPVDINNGTATDYYNARLSSAAGTILCGYWKDGVLANPLPRVQDSRFKDLATGIIYECTDENRTHVAAYEPNPIMALEEFMYTYLPDLSIEVWSADGWYKDGKLVDLEDYGMTVSEGVNVMDIITFQRVKYLTPQERLMPQVYIRTDGANRFYVATNYPFRGTADTTVGEDQNGIMVVNKLYTDEDNLHYKFENEYIERLPRESIQEFDDIKPTIEGMTNILDVGTPAERDGRIDVFEEIAYDQYDDDSIWVESIDGNVSGEYKHPHFFVKLRPLGFNLFDMALQEDMVITMNTGHCGACSFKIKVDENTKKNPVQIWERDVFVKNGSTYSRLYKAGDLKRYVDTTNLYHVIDGAYVQVDRAQYVRSGFLTNTSELTRVTTSYIRNTYSAREILGGEVGCLQQDGKTHMQGDVITSGKFISSQQDTTDNYVWLALEKDTSTYGVLMPSASPNYEDPAFSVYIRPKGIKDYPAETAEGAEEKADKFVITNIKMPQAYLRHAEKELSKAIVDYMYDNNYQKYNFSIRFSRIYLEQNENVLDNLDENSVLYVSYNSINDVRQYVSHYSYRMNNGEPLPEITVDMNEELSVYRNEAQRNALRLRQQTSDLRDELATAVAETMTESRRIFVSRNSNNIISGEIISSGASVSLNDLTASTDRYVKRIDSIQESAWAEREEYGLFRKSLDTYAAQIDQTVNTIAATMESRLSASGEFGCKTTSDGKVAFWLDKNGNEVASSTACVARPSTSWTSTYSDDY